MEGSHHPSTKQTSVSTPASDQLREYLSVYEQSPISKSQTRVLVLHPHSLDSAPLSCSLEVMTLNPNPSKIYTALSYVWGDASITEEILVNGVFFAVTSNLASALRRIRKKFGEIVLWVDAISINQKDIPERNQQVLLMNVIYSKAERVLGWLGPDEEGGSRALKTLGALLGNVIHYHNDFEWARRMPELFIANGIYTTESGQEIPSNDRLMELLLLLKRPYWRRVWIVQELTLPTDLRLMCGEIFTDMPEPVSLYRAVHRLSKKPSQRPRSVPLNLWMRLNECFARFTLFAGLKARHLHRKLQANHKWEGVSGFLRARKFLEFHESSDPRDHVYGLLGLIDLDIKPDYSEKESVADVYLKVARHCLKAAPLDILSLAGTSNRTACLTHFELPSWVPDWRLPLPETVKLPRYPQSHAFPSNGGLNMRVTDHRWLRGSAVLWDRVSRMEKKTGWDLNECDLAESIDIEKPGSLAYPSGISRFEAFVMLWLGGYDDSEANLSELQLEGDLFQSYKYIFFVKAATSWANEYGRHRADNLKHVIFGSNRPTSIPVCHGETYVVQARNLRYGMRCFHTERGYIGFGPLTTDVGDLVCVLEGHKAPVLLHGCSSHYHFVGDCDVVGIMNGEVLEAVKCGETEIAEIEIR